MRSQIRALAALLVLAIGAAGPAGAEALELEEVLARHAAARGGERWKAVRTLALSGIYAAFSEAAPFTLLRRHDDLYRLDYRLLGAPAVRARDGEGPWMLHKLLSPEAARVASEPYKGQLERESLFGPLLVMREKRGLEIRLLGLEEVDGIATIALEVELPEGATETWYLDAETFLEVVVDSEVRDLTQLPKPMRQRAFYDDFRTVAGLVLPFSVELEFGARLESMRVEQVAVDVELADTAFGPPS